MRMRVAAVQEEAFKARSCLACTRGVIGALIGIFLSERARHARAKTISLRSKNKPRGLCFSKALYGGLICGGKFAVLNQLGQLIVERKFKCYCTVFAFFILYLRQFPSISAREVKLGGAIQRSVFSATRLKGLYKGGGVFSEFYGYFFFSFLSPRLSHALCQTFQ